MIRPVLLLSLAVIQSVFGSSLRITEVTQPLYLHGSDTDPEISFQRVPFVTFHSDPEWRFAAISTPFIPPTDATWPPSDVNIASQYRIKVSGSYEDDEDFVVTIDASNAILPEGYPFTIAQAIDAVTTCVKIMYPHRSSDDGSLRITILPPSRNDRQEQDAAANP